MAVISRRKILNNCRYCKHVGVKHYDTIIPYCATCNRDNAGDRVYVCEACGLSIPATRMENTRLCTYCWIKQVA